MSAYAFVFPGQGSQSLGMLDTWAEASPVVRDTLQEANDAIGFDLAGLVASGPQEELNRTANTQPAMLMADVAIWRAWQAAGAPQPAVMAGHSLGEYAALVAADVLDFADAMRLVQKRGSWMQQAVPEGEGGMAAVVGLDDAAVISLCQTHAGEDVLEAVNFNAPGQVVVAGHQRAVQRLLDNAKAAGARMAKALPVSVPAHSALMAPVRDQLQQALGELSLRAAKIPVLHNVNAKLADNTNVSPLIAQQVCAPVRWVDTLLNMANDYSITHGLECGPGQVLCGLAKRTIKHIPFDSLAQPAQLEHWITAEDNV